MRQAFQGRKSILHTEVGGAYGGSLRALELYLEHCDHDRFVHDVLLFYPTPGSERVCALARKIIVLEKNAPAEITANSRTSRVRRWLGQSGIGRQIQGAWPWLAFSMKLPRVLRLQNILRSGAYDLVHVNNTFTYQAETLLAACSASIPTVAHVRSSVQRSAWARYAARFASTLVCVHGGITLELEAIGARGNLYVCFDGIGQVVADLPRSAELRRTIGGEKSVVVGSVGRLGPEKGYELFVRAAAIAKRVNPNLQFLLAGDGPERGRLERLIRELSLEDCFHLLGFRKDPWTVLGALDLFVCTSLREGGPLTVLESIQLGKPVISTPVGVVPELFRDEVDLLIIPPQDSKKLAEAILRLAADPELAKRLADSAKGPAVRVLDGAANARKLDEVFANCLLQTATAKH